MNTLHSRTPLLRGGDGAWLKMEAWQPVGSFKIRGIGHLCQKAQARGARRLVSSSGGNAGLAAAYAARRLALPIVVIVPETTPQFVRERLAGLGATVQVHGGVWDEADARARDMADEAGTEYVPPFDHPDIWHGHASLIEECADQGCDPDAVIVSVGGGGLMCGVLEGMHRVGWTEVPVIAVETEGAASLAAAMEAGEPVDIGAITSIATTLGARRVAAEALNWTRRHAVESALVSDAQAVAACRRFADEYRTLVEPACGASLAAWWSDERYRQPLVVVCGGAGVTLEQLDMWQARFGQHTARHEF